MIPLSVVLLYQLQDVSSVDQLIEILDEDFEYRYDLGIATSCVNVKLEDCIDIVKSFSTHFTIHAVKSELDQLCEGFKTMGVLQLIKDNKIMYPLLLARKPLPMTADLMIKMFATKFSPEGSNVREKEEDVAMKWIQYVQTIEGEYVCYKQYADTACFNKQYCAGAGVNECLQGVTSCIVP